jgi:hypothetical protein
MATAPSSLNGPSFDEESDLTLRSPLAVSVSRIGSEHDRKVHSTLCGLLIGCRVLRLSVETQFTAACLLHRYYIYNPEEDQSKWVLAACLFLAAKTENQARRLRDVVNCASQISFDPISWNPQPPNLDEEYWKAKQQIIETEKIVLRWLAFDTVVSHPHRAVVVLLDPDPDPTVAVDAFKRLNNAIFYAKALTHPVMCLAGAAVQLAIEETSQDKDKLRPRALVEEQSLQHAIQDLKQATLSLTSNP